MAERILIVEDDVHISEMLCELLQINKYIPSVAFSGTEALLIVKQNRFSLILLDLMLPGKTGEQVLKEIRENSHVPVIVLTAHTDKETTVNLLRLGADDFLSKPFDNNELLARIDVQLRRTSQYTEATNQLLFKDIILDFNCCDAVICGQRVGLSKREFGILQLLMAFPNKIFSKKNLYESVWGDEFIGDENTINVHISKLRTKLNAISPNEEYIHTVWGIGYKMCDD
ncbi:MAG: response regulator transcription factor [Oscillospiraceae bacterium]|jgi:DNA-binding response OmpR family regulator|nr:response regulator transcription factor [Oscillospiraceae bacterium]